MLPLFRAELFKLSHRFMVRVLLLLAVAAPLGAYLLLGATGDPNKSNVVNDLRIGVVYDNGGFIIYQVCVVMAIVLAATSIASEFTWGTIRTLLPRTSGRSSLITAKLVTLGLFVAATVTLGFLAALAGSALVTTFKDLDSSTGDNFIGRLLLSLLRAGFVILPYATLAFLIALWARSSAAGIAIPIVVFYAEVLLTPAFTSISALAWLPQALIYSANISSLLDSDAVLTTAELPGHWQAAGVLTAYSSGFVALTYWRFLTRDVT
jgi:ABC-2 type transport system permease protein